MTLPPSLEELKEAALSCERVSGLTHDFYRYPARFSPLFVRAAIEKFTKPGELVFDPFMGGGTTLVEARALGRKAIGLDINRLAVFTSKTKTVLLDERDLIQTARWADSLVTKGSLRTRCKRATDWIEQGYQRSISTRAAWPIRKFLEQALAKLSFVPTERQRRFLRCALLKTAQWALDCRKDIPTVDQFRGRFLANVESMSSGAREFAKAVRVATCTHRISSDGRPLCLHRSVVGIESDPRIMEKRTPTLILTSPPYPGVHVLYHRWQVEGRRESPAPFWIANVRDGSGEDFYTFGSRKQAGLTSYFENLRLSFKSLARCASEDTWVVQMVAFSDPAWQLPRYLSVMKHAGFVEVRLAALANSPDGRLWRQVPNRKWYATQTDAAFSDKEVVLFHRVK